MSLVDDLRGVMAQPSDRLRGTVVSVDNGTALVATRRGSRTAAVGSLAVKVGDDVVVEGGRVLTVRTEANAPPEYEV